jgi:RIO kinase 1
MAKIAREKFKTYGNVFDQFTLRNLFKLSSQGHFDELESPISIGKEANIFSAKRNDGSRVIIKIYRLETCDFNRMYDYLKYDARYNSTKSKKREIIFTWTQREFRNLLKAREAGVRVPLPITCLFNILVLEYIGDEGEFPNTAPKLKDSPPENPQEFLDKIIEYMKKMQKKGIVHGDLSEFNILNFHEKPVIIDMSQATVIESQNALELLVRDIRNVSKYFKKQGIKVDEDKIKEEILKKDADTQTKTYQKKTYHHKNDKNT